MLGTVLRLACILSVVLVLQSMTLSDGVLGTWEYEATNTSPEYSQGEIIIDKAEDKYKVIVSVNYSKITAYQVEVMENQVKFNINVEGADIDVTLKIEGDKLSGEAQSDEGTYALTGMRKQ